MGLRGLTAILALSIVPVFVRLLQSGLRKPRVLLLAFLAVQLIEASVSVVFGLNTPIAFWLFVIGGPFRWILYVALITEIYAAIFSNYPGIRSAVRSSMLTALFLAGVFSAVVAWFTWREHAVTSGHLYYFELAERTVLLTLLFFVLLLFVLVSRYPLRADHNLLVSSLAFSALFLIQSVVLLTEWINPLTYTQALDAVHAGIALACYATWAIAVQTGARAAVQQPIAPKASEEDLLRQLSVINATLSRAFGR